MPSTPAPADPVAAILPRLEAIERQMALTNALVAEARGVAALAMDSADQAAARMGEAELDTRLRGALSALEALTRPEVLQAVTALAEAAPSLARSAPMVEGAAGAVATFVDSLDGAAVRVMDRGIDLDARARTLLLAAERLTAPEAVRLLDTLLDRIDTVQTVLDSAVLAPPSVAVVAAAADALTETRAAPTGRAGLWAALSALGDPEVQQALDFAIRFARAFGRRLESKT